MPDKSKLVHELKKNLKILREIRGSGTELISLYISPGYPLGEITGKLRDEYGQASNIKSKATRKNVLEALEKILNYLKMFRAPPENGIAIFCGNISKDLGRPDVKLFSLEPPEPLLVQYYRCDSSFSLDPLESMLMAKDSYGLIVMDGREATLAILRGKQIRIIRTLNSTAHAKVNKGGQSQRRYQRLVEESIEKYYKRIGEAMDASFLPAGLTGVIVGGPGPAKEDFLKLKPFNYQIKMLGMVDTGYTNEYGVQELMNKSSDLITEQESIKERQVISEFLRRVVKDGLVTYGEKEVRGALESNKADTLLISEDLKLKKFSLTCVKCQAKEEKIAEKADGLKCSCGGDFRINGEVDVLDELVGLAEAKGIKIVLVSSETSEGSQFLVGFRGVGAFLRYK
ncbi:MAG: peptide chain release factor aRF-1 [Candidatus Micrarchaeota archaeon]